MVGDGEDFIYLTVLPKMWHHGVASAVLFDWPDSISALLITLHENQRCIVRLPGSRAAQRATLLDRLIDGCFGELSPDDEGDEMSPLAVRSRSKPRDAVSWSPDNDTGSLSALLILAGADRPELDGGGSPVDNVVLRPLLHAAFADEMSRNIRWLHRGYVQDTQVLTSIRGRVEAQSLARSLASNSPTVQCSYDDFSVQQPLFRVLATALDLVAAGTWLDQWSDRTPVRSAQQLRKKISNIESLRFIEAARLAQSIVLNPLLRRWQRALDLAVVILQNRVLAPSGSPNLHLDVAPTIWSQATSDFWEETIAISLRKVGARLAVQSQVEGPWARLKDSDSFPDLLVNGPEKNREDGWDWLIDAKYAEPKQTPRREYQYQMFAYAHLVPGIKRVVLAHATAGQTAEIRLGPLPMNGSMPRIRRQLIAKREEGCASGCFEDVLENADEVVLYILVLPFPRAADLRTHADWDGYLLRLGNATLALLSSEPPNGL
jgi:hypothetical protein